MKDAKIYYSVGALLYCPANHERIADAVISGKFETPYSLALCLEDTIRDDRVRDAECALIRSLAKIRREQEQTGASFYMPKIFIRVRHTAQIPDLLGRLGNARELVCGFIAPKFSMENADAYIEAVRNAEAAYGRRFYLMPIFEHPSIIPLCGRYEILYGLKEKLDTAAPYILNIRVGGNDLCHAFGFRRRAAESIHEIRPIAAILSDLMTVYGMDYVVSGPVWEYYNGQDWDAGLIRELKDDRLCGFVGKTVIHPRQIALVNDACKASKKDLEDADAILTWNKSLKSLVSGSVQKERMNEYKTHRNWALKTMLLAEIYGVK